MKSEQLRLNQDDCKVLRRRHCRVERPLGMRLAKAKGRFLNTNVKVPRATLQSS